MVDFELVFAMASRQRLLEENHTANITDDHPLALEETEPDLERVYPEMKERLTFGLQSKLLVDTLLMNVSTGWGRGTVRRLKRTETGLSTRSIGQAVPTTRLRVEQLCWSP